MNDRLRCGVDVFHVALQHAGREAGRHELAQSSVSRIVHVDHRAEELVELGWEVGDVGAGPRLEEVGLTACRHDVGVFGERVVAGPRREVFGLCLGEEANRVFAAQGLERGLSDRHRLGPESLDVGQVDLAQLHGRDAR